jgi:BolA protein
MPLKDRIKSKLMTALQPTALRVTDDSHQHAGHAGSRAGGETHFSVEIVSPLFAGKSLVARHRLVHSALADELAAGVHALAIVAKAPGE